MPGAHCEEPFRLEICFNVFIPGIASSKTETLLLGFADALLMLYLVVQGVQSK
jgi:hypothetical protein